MTELSFEWDPGKAAINALKHGITFEEAKTVFHDEYALLIDDPDHSKESSVICILAIHYIYRIARLHFPISAKQVRQTPD